MRRAYIRPAIFTGYVAACITIGAWAVVTAHWSAAVILLTVPFSAWCTVDCWKTARAHEEWKRAARSRRSR